MDNFGECEMCGKKARLRKYDLDGAIMEACDECGKYGKLVSKVPKKKSPYEPRWGPESQTSASPWQQSRSQSPSSSRPAKYRSRRPKIGDEMLVENYGAVIAKARQKAGLDRKTLAKEIKETESLILRIEQEKIHPSDTVVNKIEKYLNIKLKTINIGAISTAEYKSKSTKGMTLGDIVRIKKKK
ncbi:MAG: multiprotein bridging factor aMBF1 [Candidatus Hodarchaeales archaeon]